MTNTRPWAVLVAAALLAGCHPAPIDPQGIAPPDPVLMQPVPPLDPIPACEGQASCRARYYAQSRAQYGQCSDTATGLQQYARLVTKGGGQ